MIRPQVAPTYVMQFILTPITPHMCSSCGATPVSAPGQLCNAEDYLCARMSAVYAAKRLGSSWKESGK